MIGKLNEQIQSRGNTIRELKEKISRLTKKNSDAYPIFDLKALVSQNKDLTAKLNALHDLNERFRAENAKVKQHYKELYDSIKITRAKTTDQNNSLLSEIENLKAQLKDNSKCVTIPDSKPKVLAPGRYPIDVEPIPPRHKNNREVHLHYIKHLKENVETLREIVEDAKVERPLDTSLASACRYTKHSQELLEYVIGTNTPLKVLPTKQWKPTGRLLPLVRQCPLVRSTALKYCMPADPQETIAPVAIICVYYQPGPQLQWGSYVSKSHFSPLFKCIRTITLWTVRFGNDHFGAIMGYGDYVIGDSVIFRNGVVERRNRTLIEAARTMLIFSKAPLFLWVEVVATACYTQNRSLIHTLHNKTPYELVHDKKPDLSFLRIFGALCYPTNDNEDLGKLKAKEDIGFFVGYAPNMKGYRIYNKRTRQIMETIHVTFDDGLSNTASCTLQSQDPPPPHPPPLPPNLLTHGLISSGLVPNPPPATPYVPPTNKELEILFQPMFDEYFESSTVDRLVPPAPAAQALVNPTGPSVSIPIDQEAPSGSHSPSSSDHQSSSVHQGVAAEHLFELNPFAAIDPEPFVAAEHLVLEIIRILWTLRLSTHHFPEQNTSDSDSDSVALEHSERQPDHLEWLLDFGLIEGLLMKNDIDEIGHVMIGHELNVRHCHSDIPHVVDQLVKSNIVLIDVFTWKHLNRSNSSYNCDYLFLLCLVDTFGNLEVTYCFCTDPASNRFFSRVTIPHRNRPLLSIEHLPQG
ncbi:retrovirus-related pol polyprotein from transposon TNT 1-94 [Tanacetum coccineum]